ncbi:hypothetical protein NIES593_03715 [Hydrococcus rivularis NIES-593]|uniref:ADP-ribosylglycohydrolase n=1 Tax=Hydrococcus rivularis NIES-593 TaxID=1921803 RepID=A0A1U7HRK0_9CYAN|nr:ADP-ribosylglycohydrolase family protein [Hydrococcus rivularis]OKH26189.1 hypothetical protein NIES593_03715 [Hydrococcus rivularis NIES-593]
MRYSLLSRFQGGLLGGFLGETLIDSSSKREGTIASEIGIDSIEPWLASSTLSAEDWEQIGDRLSAALEGKTPTNSGELAVAALPILFFFHDDLGLLKEQLQHLVNIWQLSAQTLEDVLIWAYAIALALREKLDPDRLLPQILVRYRSAQTPLIDQLEQVRTWLEQGTSLRQAIAQISRDGKPNPIALALYCFARTPEDFRLCLMQAIRTGKQASLVAALTGALAGAHNSFSGIPIDWRVAVGKHPTGQKLTREATCLFAAWSGAYKLEGLDTLKSAAVTSPLVMQPRSSVKIISQGEYSFLDPLFNVDSKVIKK